MADGLIPHGDIDERSITEVEPGELASYTQCHFFAGIGGWAIALVLAGWPADREVWTGSCPCQPFSTAGRQKGKDDSRHLWPVWERLIRKCKPASIYGEQVANAIAKGWLDDVYSGLEAEGYAVAPAVLPATSVGSPQPRYRLWFVAHSSSRRLETESNGEFNRKTSGIEQANIAGNASQSVMANCDSKRFNLESVSTRQTWEHLPEADRGGKNALGDAYRAGLQRWPLPAERGDKLPSRQASVAGWDDWEWRTCADGKARLVPTEPIIQPLVDGFKQRRWLLHATGDGIVPQLAADFIIATEGWAA